MSISATFVILWKKKIWEHVTADSDWACGTTNMQLLLIVMPDVTHLFVGPS